MFRETLVHKLNALAEYGRYSGMGDPHAADPVHRLKTEIIEAFNRPRVGVGVIIFKGAPNEPPQILMEKRRHRHGHGDGEWALIGGWMENGEDWNDTARREAFEEVGIRADGGRFITAVVNTFRRDLHCVTGFVVLKNWKLDPSIYGEGTAPIAREPEKVEDLKWVPVQDIVEGKITPIFGAVVKLFQEFGSKKQFFNIDEIYRET